MLRFLNSTLNAIKMESNMQFQSKQLDRELTEPEKDSCTSTDDDFVAECSSADSSVHTPAPSGRLDRLLSEGRDLGVESAHWRKR